MTIESSGLVLASAVRLLEDTLQRVFQRISSVEAFAKTLDPRAKQVSRGRELLELLSRFNDLGHTCVSSLQAAQEPFRNCCHALVTAFVDRDSLKSGVYGAVQGMVTALQSLSDLTRRLDQVGFESSQGIVHFQERENILTFLKSFNADDVTSEKLATARRKAKFTNEGSLAEDASDWHSSLRECQQELAGVDTEVEGCLVAMQCYDSIRQVLEHRLAEAECLASSLPALVENSLDFAEVRAKLLEKASSKLATDQEKYAFEFFFPEEYAIRRNMEAGEVVFFETTKVSEALVEVVKEAS
jgi:hypothetical protein